MFKMEFYFQNLSKVLCSGVSEPTKRLAAKNRTYTLCNRQGKHDEKNEKMKKKKEIQIYEVLEIYR